MGRLISIDPGKCSGVAIFDDGALTDAYVTEQIEPVDHGAAQVVCELPRIYPTGKGKGNPNDLISVALSAGRLCALYPGTQYVFPHSWKAQVDGDIMCQRILCFLSKPEATRFQVLPKSKEHNMIDAIGIGLWHLGRMGRGGVPSGS